MKKQNKLIDEIAGNMLKRHWYILTGPRGIGKNLLVNAIASRILKEDDISFLPIIISLAEQRPASVIEVENIVINKILECTGYAADGIDFYDKIKKILINSNKRIFLFLTDVNIISNEGAVYLTNELTKLSKAKNDDKYLPLTVMLCGGMRLEEMEWDKTSRFHSAKKEIIYEIDYGNTKDKHEAESWNIPIPLIDKICEETKGVPELTENLLSMVSTSRGYDGTKQIVHQLIKKILEDNENINNDVLRSWFSHINQSEFLSIMINLKAGNKVTLEDSRLPERRIQLSGFFLVKNGHIVYRNRFIEKFLKHYISPRRAADHYLLFSHRCDDCWTKACEIYKNIPPDRRIRNGKDIIGPVYKTLSDLVTIGAMHMTNQDSEMGVLSVMDRILEYLFNIRNYFVCERKDKENNSYRIHYTSNEDYYKVGNIIDNPEQLKLFDRILETGGGWSHIWRYKYIAFPLIVNDESCMILWINNCDDYITRDLNAIVSTLASLTGLAILKLKGRQKLGNRIHMLETVLEHSKDFVQVVDVNRKIKLMNRKARENALELVSIDEVYDKKCSETFGYDDCPPQCACNEVFKDKKAHRRPERWPIPKKKGKKFFMDVNAIPLFEDDSEKLAGVIQIARDFTKMRHVTTSMIDFSQAETQEEVLNILAKAISKQGAERVRIYLPEHVIDTNTGDIEDLKSKKCLGYDEDSDFTDKFHNGDIILDGRIEKYWFEEAKKSKVPIINRIDNQLFCPQLIGEPKSNTRLIFNIPEEYDTCREETGKSKVEEWILMGLFVLDKFFGLISVDKWPQKDKFTILECDRMLSISRAAASTLYRISIPNLEQVAHMVHHSIMSPLNIIKLHARQLSKEGLTFNERLESCGIIKNVVEECKNIDINLSAITRKDDRFLRAAENVNLYEILSEIDELYQFQVRLLGNDSDIEVICAESAQIVTVRSAVAAIIYNLINNSIYALDGIQGRKRIRMECNSNNDDIILSIIDNGPGLRPNIKPRLFDLASTLRGHIGLGLYSSRIIARALGGQLKHDDSYTEGAKFDLTLVNMGD